MKLLKRYGIVPIVAKLEEPSVAQALPEEQTPVIEDYGDESGSEDELECVTKEATERAAAEDELARTLARLEDLWEDIITQKDYIEQLEFDEGCLKLDLRDTRQSLKLLEVAKVEDTEARRTRLREAEEVLRTTWSLFYDLYAVYEMGLASTAKVDDEARRLYDAYVRLKKEVTNLVNDTRVFRKITLDGLQRQATRLQEFQQLNGLANIRVQQENAIRQEFLVVDMKQKKFNDFVATRSSELEAREKKLRPKEAEMKEREEELDKRQKVLISKQQAATASHSSSPELEAGASAAETEVSRLNAERDDLKNQSSPANVKALKEEVDRLTASVASTAKKEKKLKKRSKRMEKEIRVTEKRTEVWKRLIEYDRPLQETNAVHVAYMSTKLVILKVEEDIEVGKLKEAQALLQSAEDNLAKFKGEEREHEALMTQRKEWDSRLKEEQLKLDTALSQTKETKKKVKGMQAIDEKQSLESCGTTLALRVEIAELESELDMLEKKLELYELSGH